MEQSKIEWTDHTFNCWWGCQKVSEGCKNCYAETLDNRYHHEQPHWGPGSSRKPMSENYWKQPLKWNEAAKAAGKPAKVFCASMADVFEGHPDTLPHLSRLFDLIEATPHLIWQLLTKRPENIATLIQPKWGDTFPPNVWIGTSVENQEMAEKRIPELINSASAKRYFLSMEPLLGPVDLSKVTMKFPGTGDVEWHALPAIDWIIVGGESGHNARPMHPDWLRSIRDQCQKNSVAFFFKQWGEFGPLYLTSPLGQSISYNGIGYHMHKNGKKANGRELDGRTYNEFPNY